MKEEKWWIPIFESPLIPPGWVVLTHDELATKLSSSNPQKFKNVYNAVWMQSEPDSGSEGHSTAMESPVQLDSSRYTEIIEKTEYGGTMIELLDQAIPSKNSQFLRERYRGNTLRAMVFRVLTYNDSLFSSEDAAEWFERAILLG